MSAVEHFGRVSDAELGRLRGLIGRPLKGPQPYVTQATSDAIRHWADGIGDTNPLWTDEAYAARTRFGGIIAPPTMIYAFDKFAIGYRGGLPGVHSMFGGSDWEWLAPIRLGDRITAACVLEDVIERPSRFAGRAFQQISRVTFRTQAGDVVAHGRTWGMRTERGEAAQRGKYGGLAPHHYSEAELADISAQYDAEEIRGATPRWWEDVPPGGAIPRIVRGPYTSTTAIAFEQGWGGLFIHAHRRAFAYYRRHPHAGIPNEFGVPEPPERVHWDNDLARRVGVPAAYDYGPERIAWIGTMLTNWIGDDGWLRRLHVEIRRFNLMGDTTWCHGRVTGTRQDGGQGLVDLDVWAEDQRGETTAKGVATVELPRRRPRRRRGSARDRDHASTLKGQIAIGPPHLADPNALQEHQARGIHIRQFAPTQSLQLTPDQPMMRDVKGKQLESRKLTQTETEVSSGILSQAMQEPAVGLRHDGERREPPPWEVGEEADDRGVMAVRSVEKGDEGPTIDEHRARLHGRGRPYTTRSTLWLASGSPEATLPA